MKVGYQGDVYSNSGRVAKKLFPNEKLIPLISSQNVCSSLLNGDIDIGIMAVWNTTGGYVEETKKVLQQHNLVLKQTQALPIRHYLFTAGCGMNEISKIISHPQALKQTEMYRSIELRHAETVAVDDQAQAAKELSEIKKFGVAVLCSREAGEAYGLTLVGKQDGIADNPNNTTLFGIFTRM